MNIKAELDLSHYPTNIDLKGAASIDTYTLLASLKTKVNDLDLDKLSTVSSDFSKLNNIVGNDVVKKSVYNQLVTKVIAIDTKDQALVD